MRRHVLLRHLLRAPEDLPHGIGVQTNTQSVCVLPTAVLFRRGSFHKDTCETATKTIIIQIVLARDRNIA